MSTPRCTPDMPGCMGQAAMNSCTCRGAAERAKRKAIAENEERVAAIIAERDQLRAERDGLKLNIENLRSWVDYWQKLNSEKIDTVFKLQARVKELEGQAWAGRWAGAWKRLSKELLARREDGARAQDSMDGVIGLLQARVMELEAHILADLAEWKHQEAEKMP